MLRREDPFHQLDVKSTNSTLQQFFLIDVKPLNFRYIWLGIPGLEKLQVSAQVLRGR